MSELIYNNVRFRDVEILEFSQDIEWDESKTDVLFSRFSIRVASTLVAIRYPNHQRQFGIDTQHGQTVVQRMHDIQAKLNEARKDFYFLIDSCVTDEKEPDASVLDQPLLIASGKAYSEEIVTDYINGVSRDRIKFSDLFMDPHPFSDNSTTAEYGPGDNKFSKSDVLDCNNGPKPQSVKITKIVGGRAFRVEFSIEVCRSIKSQDFDDEKPVFLGASLESSDRKVLSNRWSLSEEKDDNWITTRSTQGTLRVANRDYWPHAMRLLCIPSLLEGYRRVKQSFVSDETNLILKYRVDDVQCHASAPYPAIKMSGYHAESASGPNGVRKGGEFKIRLHGAPGVDKQQLIAAAIKMAVNRIRGLDKKPDENGNRPYSLTLQNSSIVDVLHEPSIELRCQVLFTSADYRALAMRMKHFGSSLDTLDGHEYGYDSELDPYLIAGYNPRVHPVPLPYDSKTPAGVFAAYLQHPQSVWHDIPNGFLYTESNTDDSSEFPTGEVDPPGDPEEPIESGRADGADGRSFVVGAEEYIEHEIPEDDTDLSESDDIYDFPYQYIELQNRYRINNGWVQIPIATTDPEATKTASLIQLHGRVAQRVLTMTATRDGKPPMLPSLQEDIVDENGCREVLKSWEAIAKAPQQMADGTGRRHEVWVEYVYLLERAPKPTEKLRGGSTPLDLFSPDSNSLDLSEIVDTGGHLQYLDGVTTTYPSPAAS